MSAKRKHRKNNLSFARSNTSRRLFENSKNEDSVKTETADFSDLLHKKWKVFRVSPIFNFQGSKLNVYGKKFTEELNAKQAFDSDVTYHCSFTLNKKLRLDDKSVDALQVEVITNQSKNVYLGYFISWSYANDNLKNFVSLPILLVDSKDHNAQKVHSTFCKMFDCDIQPVTFSLHALVSFLVQFLQNPHQNSTGSPEGLTLEYKIPGCSAKDSIKLALILQDTIIVSIVIIDSLCEKVPGITTMELVLEFYNRLLNHIYNVYKMDLMMAELNKISFPYAFVTADGQLKFSTNDVAISALAVLQRFTPLDAVLSN